MEFTSIGILALIVSALILIKIVIVSINAQIWWKIVKPLYKNGVVLSVVEFVLAGIVFYYLYQSGLTIVPIMACILLGALLTGMSFAIWNKETTSWAKQILKGKMIKKAWLVILIWLVLAIWTLLELFGVI